ncbi:hypothetical protein D6T65_10450 [Arthrobacter frigidicola]|nr:hypothetical protein D6T65_10450 [Arthrobacter frigidicola]
MHRLILLSGNIGCHRMRGRMNDAPSYIPPFQLGAAMTGGAVGRVGSSRPQGHSRSVRQESPVRV